MKRALVLALLALAAPASAFATDQQPAPTAVDFARAITSSANGRIRHADCVQAAPRQYMCSYGVLRKSGRLECHIMQARWTPLAASSITVTLSGRAARCRNLRDALDSLR